MTPNPHKKLLLGLFGMGMALLLLTGQAGADRRTSLEQAVNEARDRYPGRVLSAETQRRGERESHQIRILTNDGRVKRLNMDAESGRFGRPPKR